MYGEHPIELGLDRADRWVGAIRRDPMYERLSASAFPDQQDSVTPQNIVKAMASFQRAIVSARSSYDRYHFERDDVAVSDAAKRGEIIFHSRPLSCFTCHCGVHFSNAMGSRERSMAVEFHNTGLYNLPGLLRSRRPNDSRRPR
jgi:cytochrome c peroxidase